MEEQQQPKRQRHEDDSSWGWQPFRATGLLALKRSMNGQPPRERKGKAHAMPYDQLTVIQRGAARDVLGIITAEAWELAMPRQIMSYGCSLVLAFQTRTWNELSARHQVAVETHLNISETTWNGELAPFHDDLWKIEGVTMSDKEFSAGLATLRKMSRQTLQKTDLFRFLLSLERVLLPSQAVMIAETLKASTCWERLLDRDDSSDASRINAHVVVAAFLSLPQRFVDDSILAMAYWDDDWGRCAWGNASESRDAPSGRPAYATALKERYDKRLAMRRCVGPFLIGALPARVQQHQLPRSVAVIILDEWLAEPTIDPHAVEWLNGFGVSVSSLQRVE
jgi:hypothetical protein